MKTRKSKLLIAIMSLMLVVITAFGVGCSAVGTDFEKVNCSHNYEVEIQQPTLVMTGVKKYKCTECGHKFTEELPKLVQTETPAAGTQLYLHTIEVSGPTIFGTIFLKTTSSKKCTMVDVSTGEPGVLSYVLQFDGEIMSGEIYGSVTEGQYSSLNYTLYGENRNQIWKVSGFGGTGAFSFQGSSAHTIVDNVTEI